MFEPCMVILSDPKGMSGSMYMEECTICALLASNLHLFSFLGDRHDKFNASEPIISRASSLTAKSQVSFKGHNVSYTSSCDGDQSKIKGYQAHRRATIKGSR